jgi:hypothetical protein
MTDEEKVRAVWANEHYLVLSEISPQKFTFNWSWDGAIHGAFYNPADAWAAAWAFTGQRLEEIRQVREEIEWIEAESSMSSGYPYPAALRILARLEAILAEKAGGMKPEVTGRGRKEARHD